MEASSVAALQLISRLAMSSYGPGGRSKLVRTSGSSEAVLATSISHRLFSVLRVEHPVARVLVELLNHRQAHGQDGGLFTVILATQLLLAVADSRSHGRRLAALLPQVVDQCIAHVSDPCNGASVGLRLSDLNGLLALVHGVLSSKRVALTSRDDLLSGSSGGDARRLALLILSAFVQSIGHLDDRVSGSSRMGIACATSRAEERAAVLLPGVRQLCLIGGAVSDSELLEGVIIDTPLPTGTPHVQWDGKTSRRGLRLALFNGSLEPVLPVNLGARAWFEPVPFGVMSPLEALLAAFVEGLLAAAVSVVASQQRISPILLRMLHAKGIAALPRLSLRHIDAVTRLSGATPISHLQVPDAGSFGMLGGLRRRLFCGREYLQLLPSHPLVASATAQPVCTLVLYAPHRAASEELAPLVTTALATLGTALAEHRPLLLPGAGCIEALMVAFLRGESARVGAFDPSSESRDCDRKAASSATASRRMRQRALQVLATAFESVIEALAGSMHGSVEPGEAAQVLHELNSSQSRNQFQQGDRCLACYGWDADHACAVEVLRLKQTVEGTQRDDGRPGCGTTACDKELSAEDLSNTAMIDEHSSSTGKVDTRGHTGRFVHPTPTAAPHHVQTRAVYASVLELASCKLGAIRAAVELACALLAVDGVLVDSR